jgi:hypothetical protein
MDDLQKCARSVSSMNVSARREKLDSIWCSGTLWRMDESLWNNVMRFLWCLPTEGIWNECLSFVDDDLIPAHMIVNSIHLRTVYERNYLTSELFLPAPKDVELFHTTKRDHLQRSVKIRTADYHARSEWKEYFSTHVVSEINDEVAYRPPATPTRMGMKKYIECMDHFDSMRTSLDMT